MQKKYKNEGYIMAIVLTFIFIVMFAIFGSSYIFSNYFGNIETEDIYNRVNIDLNNQLLYFKKTLIYTNSNGGGYLTRTSEKKDIENDDDDFNGTTNDVDGVSDDDGDAFKYRFGVVVPDREENVLFFDNKYFDYANFTLSTLSGITIYTSIPGTYQILLFDGNYYSLDNKFKLKQTIEGPLIGGEKNDININKIKDIVGNDILAFYIKNVNNENLAYKIKGISQNGEDLPYFMPVNIKGRNFDLYVNTLIKSQHGDFFEFNKIYYDILEGGKRPVAPSNLSGYGSGDILYLDWDINDLTNTGSYYLFRGTDANIDCGEQYFLTKIGSGYINNSFSGNLHIAGSFYYTICASNTVGGTGFTDIGKLSTPSNIINIIK